MAKINPGVKKKKKHRGRKIRPSLGTEVKKAVIPVAGLGTRFLPLSKVLPKEFWPLADIPVIQYIVEEAADSGIKEIIFIDKPGKKIINDYFKKNLKSKKASISKYKSHFLKEVKRLENISKNISFSRVFQKNPFGAAHAVFQAEKAAGKKPCAVLWADDVVDSKIPCLLQLIKVFKKYQKPIIALCRVPKESFQFYGMAEVEIVAKRTYKIKRVFEKPPANKAPSNLAVVGKYILTPEVFNYLKKTPFNIRADVSLTETLSEMAEDGREIYGYEFDGKWLECGNKLAYLKSNLYFSLKHSQFGPQLKKYLKKS